MDNSEATQQMIIRIRNARFRTTRFRPGYDMLEVDDYLDQAISRLQEGRSPAAPGGFSVARLRPAYAREDVDALVAEITGSGARLRARRALRAGLWNFPHDVQGVLSRALLVEEVAAMMAHGMRWMAGRVTSAVREMNEVQRRLAVLRLATDRYLADPNAAPDTYAEFLMRTSGPLTREASARARARG